MFALVPTPRQFSKEEQAHLKIRRDLGFVFLQSKHLAFSPWKYKPSVVLCTKLDKLILKQNSFFFNFLLSSATFLARWTSAGTKPRQSRVPPPSLRQSVVTEALHWTPGPAHRRTCEARPCLLGKHLIRLGRMVG